MVNQKTIDDQLKTIGASFRLWGRNEIKELSLVMADNEVIKQCVNGHYIGGFAMLVATDRRLFLIDRKPMFLTLEVIWYDKIGQIDFNNHLLNATLCVSTPNKDLQFTTWNSPKLRIILLYSQEKIAQAEEDQNTFEYYSEPQYQSAPHRPGQLYPDFESNTPSSINMHQPANSQERPAVDMNKSFSRSPNAAGSILNTSVRLPFSRRRYFSRQTF